MQTFKKISCGYVGSKCYSNICWVRNNQDETCKDARVRPIDKCSAYQATRAMTIIGTIFLIVGASLLVVSVCVVSANLTTYGAVSTLVAATFLMIAFAVFLGGVFNAGDLGDTAKIDWSFILLIVAWPLALLAGVLAFVARPAAKQVTDDMDESE